MSASILARNREANERERYQREICGKAYAYCGGCKMALQPCPKGPNADEPGFVGFYPCCPGAEVIYK